MKPGSNKRRTRAAGPTAALALAVCAIATASASAGLGDVIGADGVGDPFFPKAGNTGYQVEHYDIDLSYKRSGAIRAVTTIDAVGATGALTSLERFDLDYRGPHIRSLRVGGAEAGFERSGQELIVTPVTAIAHGDPFTVKVRYAGKPGPVTDPDGTDEGWIRTNDGAVVLPEPQGAPAWFPCNDHPTDKASYRIRVVTPAGLQSVASGRMVFRNRRAGKRRVSLWEQEEPMATALATVGIGRYRISRGKLGGHQYVQAIDRSLGRHAKVLRTRTRRAYTFLTAVLGPYPFSSVGGIVDPNGVGYSLETQTRPVYPETPSIELAVHELGHQWAGDSVSLATWDQIWLNEGFATYLEWLYTEGHVGPTAAKNFGNFYDGHGPGDNTFWNPPPGDPGTPVRLFDDTIYVRGAMTLHALRLRIGDPDFFQLLRDWMAAHQYGNVSSSDFEALAESVSGQDLDALFDEWLRTPGKPSDPRS